MTALSTSAHRRLTPEEYLAIEARAETKSEYYRGDMFAMSGAGVPHNTIKDNLVVELGGRLRGGPCRTLSSDQRVKVTATGLYTYPDLVVVCGAPELEPLDRHTLTNPQVLVEVLSPSTEAYDRGAKLRHYQQLSSVREIVLVSQDAPLVWVIARRPDQTWGALVVAGLDAAFRLESIGVQVALVDVYRNVEFPPAPSRPAAPAE